MYHPETKRWFFEMIMNIDMTTRGFNGVRLPDFAQISWVFVSFSGRPSPWNRDPLCPGTKYLICWIWPLLSQNGLRHKNSLLYLYWRKSKFTPTFLRYLAKNGYSLLTLLAGTTPLSHCSFPVVRAIASAKWAQSQTELIGQKTFSSAFFFFNYEGLWQFPKSKT